MKNIRRGTGSVYQGPASPNWYICYSVGGKTFRESANTKLETEAKDRLKERIGEISNGSFSGVKVKRIKVQELAADMVRDYRINGKKSLPDLEERWKLHLSPFFGHLRAVNVSTDLIARYIDRRQQEGAANATINRELAALKRMFNLATEATPPKVTRVPHVPHLAENNVRTGFLEQHQYEKLADFFSGVGLWMRSIFEVGHTYGWRVSEILNLRVKQVDFLNGIIRLETGTTKNKKGRVVKMTAKVSQLLQQCCHGKKPDDLLFTRVTVDGRHKPIVDFRDVWANGCKAAGCPDLLFHDLRRTGARNLVRAGVAAHHAAKITGHKTLSVFNRYDIIDERDIADAVDKLERHQTSTAQLLHTGTKNEKAQPARVGLSN